MVKENRMTLFEAIENEAASFPSVSLQDEENTLQLVKDMNEIMIYRTASGNWVFRLKRCGGKAEDKPVSLKVSSDYMRIEKDLCGMREDEIPNYRFLLRTVFECRFAFQGIVSLHAACVDLDGFAVAFTGPSGLGKSTRARAWVNASNALLISGDRPAVRLTADGNTACGVPWDGKEQVFRDVERPLKCILEVRRSHVNYIRKLTDKQANEVIVRQALIPMWDTDAAALALINVRRLIHTTPIYRVFCGPNEEDAREIYDIIVHHTDQIRKEADEMKIKKGFVLRNVVGEYMVMPTGENIDSFGGTAVLNEVSAFVFKKLENAVSREDLLIALLNEYDVERETAEKDVDNLLEQFDRLGLLEK